MLVLLVIFMVTAPLTNPGQVELPSIGKASNPPAAPIEVSIHTDQTLSLRDRSTTVDDRKMSRDDLLAAIRQKQAKNPEQAVVIAAELMQLGARARALDVDAANTVNAANDEDVHP